MKMLEITALENGAHRNQTFNGVLPDGWAIIPDGMETENFPFGEVTAKKVNGVMTVTVWVAGEIPASDDDEGDENVGYIPTPTLRGRVAALEESTAALEDALCEMDAANAQAIAAIEDALCELDS